MSFAAGVGWKVKSASRPSDDRRTWLREVVGECELDESCARSKIELAPDAGAVPLGGTHGDVQPVRDFPVCVSVSEQLEDFAFAGGEEFGAGHGRLSHWRLPERATSVFPGTCAQLSTEADPVVRTEDAGLRRGIIVVMPPASVAIGA